jgi:hypothetical protein
VAAVIAVYFGEGGGIVAEYLPSVTMESQQADVC